MGESIPQVNPLSDPRAGSISLADWLDLTETTPAVRNQLNLLVPTQEMRDFQRQVRTRVLTVSPNVGEVAIFSGVVPDDEAWKLLWVSYLHTDTVSHEVRLSILPGVPNAIIHNIDRTTVILGLETPLYPSSGADFFNADRKSVV